MVNFDNEQYSKGKKIGFNCRSPIIKKFKIKGVLNTCLN